MLRPSLLQVVRQVEDLQVVGAADPVETKSKNPKPGSKAAPPPQRARDCTARSSPSRDWLRLAPHPGLLRAEPGGSLFMRERGELQRGGGSTRTQLHKRAVLQHPGPGRVFKSLGAPAFHVSLDERRESCDVLARELMSLSREFVHRSLQIARSAERARSRLASRRRRSMWLRSSSSRKK